MFISFLHPYSPVPSQTEGNMNRSMFCGCAGRTLNRYPSSSKPSVPKYGIDWTAAWDACGATFIRCGAVHHASIFVLPFLKFYAKNVLRRRKRWLKNFCHNVFVSRSVAATEARENPFPLCGWRMACLCCFRLVKTNGSILSRWKWCGKPTACAWKCLTSGGANWLTATWHMPEWSWSRESSAANLLPIVAKVGRGFSAKR